MQPMLAQTGRRSSRTPGSGSARAAVEWKLDGVRVQVHRDGDESRLHPQPGRHHRPGARGRRGGRSRCRPGRRARRRGDRARPGRPAAPVPGDRCAGSARRLDVDACAARAAAVAVLLRPAAPRRRGPARPARRRSGRTRSSACVPGDAAGARDSSPTTSRQAAGVLRRALAARPRRRGGQVARRAVRGRPARRRLAQGEAAAHARPGGARRRVGHGRRQGWLSNLHLGARDPARAASSCSARRSRV